MRRRFYQHPVHGSLSAVLRDGKVLFPLSGITGIRRLGAFGPEWIASYAEKHHVMPVRTKGGGDCLLDETTVLDFISTLIDDVDLVDWLINSVIKDLQGIKEPRFGGNHGAPERWAGEDGMNPRNSVSTWLLHPMLAPHLEYSKWIRSLIDFCALGQEQPGIRIGKRSDGTIAINPMLALGLGMEAELFPAMVVLGSIQDQGALAHHESPSTFDSILRRHSVMFFSESPVKNG